VQTRIANMTAGRLESRTTCSVKALESPLRAPTTDVERRVLAALAHHGPLPLQALVDRIAGELYRDELRHGGWALEIGLIGSALFRSDVQRAVEDATDILWVIEGPSAPGTPLSGLAGW
jgi:hypothetical protein